MPNHNEITNIFNAIVRLGLQGKPYSILLTIQDCGFRQMISL